MQYIVTTCLIYVSVVFFVGIMTLKKGQQYRKKTNHDIVESSEDSYSSDSSKEVNDDVFQNAPQNDNAVRIDQQQINDQFQQMQQNLFRLEL